MSLIVREKTFYRSLVLICIPITLQNVVNYAINLLDTLMLGSLSQNALSAAALANQPFFILMLMIFGFGSGASVLIAQYWGKKDIKAINHVVGIAMMGALIMSTLFTVLCVGFPEFVMRIYSGDAPIIELGAQYLRILGITYIFYGISSTLLLNFRSVEQVMLPLGVSFVGMIVNLAFNWLLIFGNLGFPRLEVRGAAIATLIARLVEFTIVIVYTFFIDKRLRLKVLELFRIHKPMLKEFVRYSIPVLGSETFWGLGTSVHSMIIGHMGDNAIAAYSVGGMLDRLAYIAIAGLSTAALVMIGKQLGAGDLRRGRDYGNTLTLMCLAFGLVGGAAMVIFRGAFIGMYSLTPEAYDYAMSIMLGMAFYMVIKAINSPLIVGALRAGGDTRFAMAMDIIPLWGISIPLGIVAAFVWRLPVYIVYLFLLMDELVKMIFVLWRYVSGKWVRNITKENIAADA